MSYTNADDAQLARKMAARAKQCAALLTSHKLGWNSRMSGVPTAEIDILVTDAIAADVAASLELAGVSTIEAPVDQAETE